MRALAFVFCLISAPVSAGTFCDELWLTRNQVFDQAGYCFGSTLGKTVFNNADCTTKNPVLNAQAKQLVDRIKAEETASRCAVNTGGRQLDVPLLAQRLQLHDLPIRDDTESACIGWRGPDMPLFAGRNAQTMSIGTIRPGDTIFSAHLSADGWDFVILQRGGQEVALGWTPGIAYDTDSCADFAG